MPTTTITAEYVNEPKGKGPGNIKDSRGQYYKVWKESKAPGQAVLSQFEKGKTYEVEFKDDGEYNGKPQYMITKVLSASTSTNGSANGSNVHDASAQFRNGASQSDEMKWGCSLKVAALLFVGTKDVDGMLVAARFIFNEPASVVEEAKRLFNATEAPV